jgi:hypothetical protein
MMLKDGVNKLLKATLLEEKLTINGQKSVAQRRRANFY